MKPDRELWKQSVPREIEYSSWQKKFTATQDQN